MKISYGEDLSFGLFETLQRHEGSVINVDGRHVIYDDATGKSLGPGDTLIGHPTIGYGRNVQDRGLSQEIVESMLLKDIFEFNEILNRHLYWFRDMPQQIQEVLLNMAFQMGFRGLTGFVKTLGYLKQKQFAEAADEMLDSQWAREDSPTRARELSNIVRSVAQAPQESH